MIHIYIYRLMYRLMHIYIYMHVSYFGVLSRTGIIYEVACQQCGGSDHLENAVKRGDVKRKGSIYYLP